MVRSYSVRLRKLRVIKFLYSEVSGFKLGPDSREELTSPSRKIREMLLSERENF